MTFKLYTLKQEQRKQKSIKWNFHTFEELILKSENPLMSRNWKGNIKMLTVIITSNFPSTFSRAHKDLLRKICIHLLLMRANDVDMKERIFQQVVSHPQLSHIVYTLTRINFLMDSFFLLLLGCHECKKFSLLFYAFHIKHEKRGKKILWARKFFSCRKVVHGSLGDSRSVCFSIRDQC